jgi:predicted RNase H-like HicB family nuclease
VVTPADTVIGVAALTEYLHAAMRHAEYQRLEEGDWYAHIPGLVGLWASAKTVEDTRNDLLSALEDWLYVNAYVARCELPEFDGLSIAAPPHRADS